MSKRKNVLASVGIVACMALAVLFTPVATLPVHAQAPSAEDEGIMPMRDAISWVFKIENYKAYKRLYNHSTGEWIGDWIFLRDMPRDTTPPYSP